MFMLISLNFFPSTKFACGPKNVQELEVKDIQSICRTERV